MAQGEATQEEAEHVKEGLNELLEDLGDEKTAEWLGLFNDAFLFLGAAAEELPSEDEAEE